MKTRTCIHAVALVLAGGMATAVLAGPPGKGGIPSHPKDPVPVQDFECTPRPGTESMTHDPEEHPMPKTRGMKRMDPAMHMQECVQRDAPEAPDKRHDHGKHKKTGPA